MCSTMFATTMNIYTLARVDWEVGRGGGGGARYVVYCNGRLLGSGVWLHQHI